MKLPRMMEVRRATSGWCRTSGGGRRHCGAPSEPQPPSAPPELPVLPTYPGIRAPVQPPRLPLAIKLNCPTGDDESRQQDSRTMNAM